MLLTFGLGAGVIFGSTSGLGKLNPTLPSIVLPNAADFWLALTVLVIPQLPLTLGNLAFGFVAGILLHYLLNSTSRAWRHFFVKASYY